MHLLLESSINSPVVNMCLPGAKAVGQLFLGIQQLAYCVADDCQDVSPELFQHYQQKHAKDKNFLCGNGRLIPCVDVSNYKDNCGDGSDETNVAQKLCDQKQHESDVPPLETMFCNSTDLTNNTTNKEISVVKICDYFKDCPDGSDEKGCKDQFQCEVSCNSIPSAWVNDNQTDCPNSTDEPELVSQDFEGSTKVISMTDTLTTSLPVHNNSTNLEAESSAERPKTIAVPTNLTISDDYIFSCDKKSWKLKTEDEPSDYAVSDYAVSDYAVSDYAVDVDDYYDDSVSHDAIELEKTQVCDLYKDCDNGSDEYCKTARDFRNIGKANCYSTPPQAIPISKMCDKVSDCSNNWDEYECDQTFLCQTEPLKKIPAKQFCDGKIDCAENNDEPQNCEKMIENYVQSLTKHNTTIPSTPIIAKPVGVLEECAENESPEFDCGTGQFWVGLHDKVKSNGVTVPSEAICDGIVDCMNGEDEFCNNRDYYKLFGKLLCNDGKTIIRLKQLCDGVDDCPDGRDEACEELFQCANGQKIPKSWECDQDIDCSDFSDEANCPKIQSGENGASTISPSTPTPITQTVTVNSSNDLTNYGYLWAIFGATVMGTAIYSTCVCKSYRAQRKYAKATMPEALGSALKEPMYFIKIRAINRHAQAELNDIKTLPCEDVNQVTETTLMMDSK